MSEVARANGDESLVRQLEAEINYYRASLLAEYKSKGMSRVASLYKSPTLVY